MTTFAKNSVCPVEVTRLLTLLGKTSSEDQWRIMLQQDKSLLIDCIYLLRMVHDTTKGKPNSDADIDMESPIYGLKCNLVRVIGNLCYQNPANQDEVCLL